MSIYSHVQYAEATTAGILQHNLLFDPSPWLPSSYVLLHLTFLLFLPRQIYSFQLLTLDLSIIRRILHPHNFHLPPHPPPLVPKNTAIYLFDRAKHVLHLV
jgi:hypothetical protein